MLVTVTLFALACTFVTLPSPVTLEPAADTVTVPTDAFFSTVRVALSVTATLLTEPDRDRSDFAVTVPTLPPDTEIAAAPFGLLTSTPFPAVVFLMLTASAPPRMTMRPVTLTLSSDTLSALSAMMRSPLMVMPESDAPLSRTTMLPSTVLPETPSAPT